MRKDQCICSECRNELDIQADYCIHCGALFRTDQDCINHEEVKATSVCVICNRPLCHMCVTRHNGVAYCVKHRPGTYHQSILSRTSSDKHMIEYCVPEGAMFVQRHMG